MFPWQIVCTTNQPTNQPVGIPIGNLTSQFFANVYLDGMDHFLKESLKCRYYLRYMDDFVIFHHEKKFLWFVKKEIIGFLKTLRLELHEGKCRIYETEKGCPFLGMVISKTRRRIKRENYIRYRRRLKMKKLLYDQQKLTLQEIGQSIQAWIGHVKHANTVKLREFLLGDINF